MMDVRLLPAPLRGAVTPPPSKSLLHRQLICLAQAGEFPCPPDPSDDVEATVRGLWALYHEKAPVIDCGASGSTLRFLLPLAMARGQVGTVFTGTERLLERPLPGDWGLAATAGGLRVTRTLSGGQLPVDRTRTSQLLSGMRAVTFKSEGETLDLSAFLGSAAEDEESESVEAASAAAAVADELASDEK